MEAESILVFPKHDQKYNAEERENILLRLSAY